MKYLLALFTLSAFAMTNYQASITSSAYGDQESCERTEKAPCYAFEVGQDRETLDHVLVNGKRETRVNPTKKADKETRLKAEEDARQAKALSCEGARQAAKAAVKENEIQKTMIDFIRACLL